MKPILYPYKLGSKSAGVLAQALGTKKVKPDGKYKPFGNHLIINWGNSNQPNWWNKFNQVHAKILNYPNYVHRASNKLLAFKVMKEEGVSVPEFTTNKDVVKEWEGDLVAFARTKLQGTKGDGIIPITFGDNIPHAPLYVRYIKKKFEYRVHVFNGKVIDVQQKKKRQEVPNEEVNYQIRNHDNGWNFCRDGVNPPAAVLEEAKKAVEALMLSFGAVDIIWNSHQQKAYVLEVNTAPGLEGQTINIYHNAIQELL